MNRERLTGNWQIAGILKNGKEKFRFGNQRSKTTKNQEDEQGGTVLQASRKRSKMGSSIMKTAA